MGSPSVAVDGLTLREHEMLGSRSGAGPARPATGRTQNRKTRPFRAFAQGARTGAAIDDM